MKRAIFFIVFTCIAWNLSAQNSSSKIKVNVIHPAHFGISKPLRELFTNDEDSKQSGELLEVHDKEHRLPQVFKYTASDGIKYGDDIRIRQTTMGTRSAVSPLANWAGQNTNANPPDPTGAAGINYYVQTVNATRVKVFDKNTGAQVGSVINIGSLWSPAVSTLGDPIVLYDKYADRWILTHLGTSSDQLLIAVSTSGDPTGTYYTYSYSSPDFPDYPKYSIWADGYYMTTNYLSNDIAIPQAVFCFERNEMLAGNPAARAIYSPFSPGVNSDNFYLPMPADADGQLPPFGTPLPFIAYYENSWGGGDDSLKIWNMSVDWNPSLPTATIAGPDVLLPAAFDGTFNNNWTDIPQPNTTAKLDGMGGIIQFRTQWRKWTGYNTLVICWPVNLNSNPIQRSIRWAELRQDQISNAWSIYQESTYAPDDYSRWMGSVAMDDEGNIGLCYAKSGPTSVTPLVFPSLGYTGRLAGDPLNTMTFDETIAVAGAGFRTGIRFGDYAQTSIDPDGLTFWHTGEYIGVSGAQRTRIYSFKLSSLTSVANSELIKPEIFAYQSENLLVVTANNLPSNDLMVLDLFDVNGRIVKSKIAVPVSYAIHASFDVLALAKGNYMVRIGKTNSNFQKIIKVAIF